MAKENSSNGGLKTYRKKRDFRKSPEPSGGGATEADGRSFVVQKHDASRLHYDFRLEMDGVLKSWAVPKGPSLDPDQKRLAVHVEDHPLAYAGFEGVIPEAEYGGGTVMVWDRGRWEPTDDPEKGYQKGDLKFRLSGEKLSGEWALVRMKGRGEKNWLLIKKKDEAAQTRGDILDQSPDSVLSGRSMAEIAGDRDRVWSSDGGPGLEEIRDRVEATEEKEGRSGSKRRDPAELSGAGKSDLPKTFRPQLATLVDDPPGGEDWLHEIKLDGYRILAFIRDGRVRLITRNGKDWTSKFSGIADALGRFPLDRALLDGELVAMDDEGHSDFQTLQNSLKGRTDARLIYYVFDIPHAGDHDLTRSPLAERKELLEGLMGEMAADGPVRYSEHIRGRAREVYTQACRLSLEGVISKKADAGYQQRRSRSWRKSKCMERQEFVIGGYTEPSGSRTGFGALLLGHYDGEDLVYAGKVGTGFDEETLEEMKSKLARLERKTPPFSNPPEGREARGVHWVTPKLVGEVTFTQWTEDGYLRHPAFMGLREDKAPDRVVREAPAPPESGEKSEPSDGDGRVAGIRLSNPDRVLYPDQGITKRALAEYYVRIVDWILPHVAERPLTLVRCPRGREKGCFYQKHLSEGVPDGVEAVEIREEKGKGTYVYVREAAGLIALVQLGTLEFHPWGSRIDKVDRPDRMIFDLDPGPEVDWEEIVAGTETVRDRLADLGLSSFVKTSGGKGLHVVVPLVRRSGWDEVREFSKAVAKGLAGEMPDRYIATAGKQKRKGKVFVDYLRNSRGATSVCAYGTRARKGAPVSAPIRWDELTPKLRPDAYTIENLKDRLSSLQGDPWEGFFDLRQSITKSMKRSVGID